MYYTPYIVMYNIDIRMAYFVKIKGLIILYYCSYFGEEGLSLLEETIVRES